MTLMVTKISLWALGVVLLLSALGARAQTVTLLVPYAAGGPSDSLARTLVPAMSRALNTPVVISNVLGNRGVTGAIQATAAPADGLTLLYADLALASALKTANKGVSLLDHFDPVGIIGERPLILVTAPNGRFNEMMQLNDGARFGSSGVGTISDRCAQTLKDRIGGSSSVQPAFAGGAPLMTALLSNAIDVACIEADPSVNRVRVLAISRPSVHPLLRDTKTFKEQSFDIEYRGIVGLFFVKGVENEKRKAMELALLNVLSQPAIRSKLEQDFFLSLD